MKPNYNAQKRRKELDRKKKKEEKDLKRKLRKEAIARGEIPEGEEELIAEYTDSLVDTDDETEEEDSEDNQER